MKPLGIAALSLIVGVILATAFTAAYFDNTALPTTTLTVTSNSIVKYNSTVTQTLLVSGSQTLSASTTTVTLAQQTQTITVTGTATYLPYNYTGNIPNEQQQINGACWVVAADRNGTSYLIFDSAAIVSEYQGKGTTAFMVGCPQAG